MKNTETCLNSKKMFSEQAVYGRGTKIGKKVFLMMDRKMFIAETGDNISPDQRTVVNKDGNGSLNCHVTR